MLEVDTLNVDFDRSTGATLRGWPAVEQNIREGLVTDLGVRVRREHYGSFVPRALGRNLNTQTILALTARVAAFVDVFEPRFKVVRAVPSDLSRQGELNITIDGEFRPRALLGDETGSERKDITVKLSDGKVGVLHDTD